MIKSTKPWAFWARSAADIHIIYAIKELKLTDTLTVKIDTGRNNMEKIAHAP